MGARRPQLQAEHPRLSRGLAVSEVGEHSWAEPTSGPEDSVQLSDFCPQLLYPSTPSKLRHPSIPCLCISETGVHNQRVLVPHCPPVPCDSEKVVPAHGTCVSSSIMQGAVERKIAKRRAVLCPALTTWAHATSNYSVAFPATPWVPSMCFPLPSTVRVRTRCS